MLGRVFRPCTVTTPAQQRLRTHHRLARAIEDRLKVGRELSVVHRPAQIQDLIAVRNRARRAAHPLAVQDHLSTARPLGGVHGHIGVNQQFLHGPAMCGEHGDARACPKLYGVALDFRDGADLPDDAFDNDMRPLLRGFAASEICQDHRELVAAQPRNMVRIAHGSA